MSVPDRAARGFTLAEVLVSGTLFLLVLGVVAGFLIPGMRAWMRGREQSEAQQNALLAMLALREAARWSHPESIGPIDSSSLRMYSTRCPDGPSFQKETGQVEYHNWELFYLDRGMLRQHDVALALDARGKLPTELPADLSTSAPSLATDARDRVLARNIEGFRCRTGPDGVEIQVDSRVGASTSHIETRLVPGQMDP